MTDINRMLINATHSEELRVAMVHGYHLDNLYIEHQGNQKKGNIYKGKITRIEPSLQAAFVDFGADRHGFLPLKEISSVYFSKKVHSHDAIQINEVLKEGQELIVQVEKIERGNKGAALTTYVKLAGCYLVLIANNSRAGGISRQIEGDERDELKDIMDNLTIPDDMGIIIRTAGVGKSHEEIAWDMEVLLRLWEAIDKTSQTKEAPFLIHQESDFVIRAIRDYLRQDTEEIIVDNPEVFTRVKEHIERIRPEFIERIKLYQQPLPLFVAFKIESQIETAFQPEVRLPSGGSIVIQTTEAMVTIDVNSSKDTKGGNIEQTALNTNKEAAVEVARQLRLRDIGGLVAVDFIDMLSQDNQREIVNIFQNAIKNDRARLQYSRISKFGLMEISRQRLRPSLVESSQIVCPRCNGQGSIRHVESLSFYILRVLRQEAIHEKIHEITAFLPVDVATLILNEKRHVLADIEQRQNVRIFIIPSPSIETPHYKIEKQFKGGQLGESETTPSFKREYENQEVGLQHLHHKSHTLETEQPMLNYVPPHPSSIPKKKKGILQGLIRLFSNKSKPQQKAHSKVEEKEEGQNRRSRGNPHRSHRGRGPKKPSKNKGSGSGRQDRPRNEHRHAQRFDASEKKPRPDKKDSMNTSQDYTAPTKDFESETSER